MKKLPYKINDDVTITKIRFCSSNGRCIGKYLIEEWVSGKNNEVSQKKPVVVFIDGTHKNNKVSIRLHPNGKLGVRLGVSKSINFNTNRSMNEYLETFTRDLLSNLKQITLKSGPTISNITASGIYLFPNPTKKNKIKQLRLFCLDLVQRLKKFNYVLAEKEESNRKALNKYQLKSMNAPTIGIFQTGTCDMMSINKLSQALEIEKALKDAFKELNPVLTGGNASYQFRFY